MKETWVLSLDQEDPIVNAMAIQSSIFACRIPWTQEPGRLQYLGSQRIRHHYTTFTFTSCLEWAGESSHRVNHSTIYRLRKAQFSNMTYKNKSSQLHYLLPLYCSAF